ncbi:MAG: exosome complex protein Rrp42 [Candidatus Bathyarchaeia archaeon]
MSMTPQTTPAAKIEQEWIRDLASKNRRMDGRAPSDYRKITVETGTIEKANGSAQVTLGKTKVLVGVKLELGEPFPDTPNEGVLTVNAELTPIAHSSFELGPPGENAIELARVVDRNLRESKAIDLKELCIEPGKKVFIVFVDIYVLDHDGNLVDASTYGALAALLKCRMPEYEIRDGEIVYTGSSKPLPMRNYPVPVTFAKIGRTLIVDPCLKEEEVMSTRLTVGVDKEGCVCAMQKGGMGALEIHEVTSAVEAAMLKSEEIRKLIMEAAS